MIRDKTFYTRSNSISILNRRTDVKLCLISKITLQITFYQWQDIEI